MREPQRQRRERHIDLDLRDFAPTPTQQRFLDCRARQVLLAGGYGSGKTRVGAEAAVDLALANPGCAGLVASPTWQLRDRTTMPALNAALPRELIAKHHVSLRKIDLVNSSTIYYGSADNPGSLEGTNLAWVWADEARLMKHEAYKIIVGRIRDKRARRSQLVVTTTPTMGWLYEEFMRAKPGRVAFRSSTRENAHNLSPGFIEELEQTYSKRVAKALIDGEFVETTAGVYPEFSEDRHVVDFEPAGQHDTVLGIDFGVNSPSVIVAQVLAHDVWAEGRMLPRGAIVIVDEVHPDQTPTTRLHLAVERLPVAQWARRAYVDPAGAGRDQATGMRSVEVIEASLGVEARYSTDPEERWIPNGIALVNQMLDPLAGPPMLYVARRVLSTEQRRGVVSMFRSFRYPERDGRQSSDHPLKDGVVDHAADAVRYLVTGVARDRRGHRSEMLTRTLYEQAA